MIDDIITILVIIIILSVIIYQLQSTSSTPTKSASIFGSSFFKKDDIEYVIVRDSKDNDNLSRIHAAEFLAPTGTIVLWPGVVEPDGWGFCNGSPIPAESELRNKLGVTNTPNLGGVAIEGATTNVETSNINSTDGSNTIQLTTNHIPLHNHSLSWGGTASGKFQPLPWDSYIRMQDYNRSTTRCQEVNDDGGDKKSAYTIGTNASDYNWDPLREISLVTATNNTGTTTTLDIRQPSIILNYIIKF
jgi:microcystin-dependent protein